MAALTAPRDTLARDGTRVTRGVAAGVTIFAGSLVCLNAGKFAVPGAVSPNLITDGRAQRTTVGGAVDGAVTIDVERGLYRYDNSAGADAIAQADVGNDCFVIDDHTVAKTNPGGNTRSVAGKIVDVEPLGVWVRIGIR